MKKSGIPLRTALHFEDNNVIFLLSLIAEKIIMSLFMLII